MLCDPAMRPARSVERAEEDAVIRRGRLLRMPAHGSLGDYRLVAEASMDRDRPARPFDKGV